MWIYTSTPSARLHGVVNRENFTFYPAFPYIYSECLRNYFEATESQEAKRNTSSTKEARIIEELSEYH
jgi:hypothetical protein